MSGARSIPEGCDFAAVAAIDARLAAIEAEEGIRILWAVESGSRAWGFPSPDSDYDCRFIYCRRLDDYLSVVPPKRDVIETPIEGLLDVNGWDLFKTAKLILGGNAVALEWLSSPIVYRGDPAFRQDWRELAEAAVDRDALMRHYFHLGRKQTELFLADRSAVLLKKLFYALRPALVLRWLRMHPARSVPPMDMTRLLAETRLPPDSLDAIIALMARKAETRELGTGPVPGPIHDLMRQEFAQIQGMERVPQSAEKATILKMDRVIRHWIGRASAEVEANTQPS